jgi:hypothetical protein
MFEIVYHTVCAVGFSMIVIACMYVCGIGSRVDTSGYDYYDYDYDD